MDTIEDSEAGQCGAGSRFPDTLWSIVITAGSDNGSRASAALGRLCAAYRQPIYQWLCSAGHDPHQADEAVQDFILHLLQRHRLPLLSPHGSRFRVWLLTCLRHRMQDRREADLAAKRGGGLPHIPLSQLEIPAPDGMPDRLLDQQCAAAVHERALARLLARWQQAGNRAQFEALQPFILAAPVNSDYLDAGRQLGLRPQHVKRVVFRLRSEYFAAFRAEVSQTVAPCDLADEVRHLASFLPDLIPN